MDLTKEMQAYLDGFSDGFSRGYQDAIVAEASKVRIELKGEGCNVVAESEKQNFSPGSSSSESSSGSSDL